MSIKPFKFRGPNSFYFKKKRWEIYSLKAQMASTRVSLPGGGGSFDTITGDGEAWHKDSERGNSGYFRKRIIKAGKWFGWWIRIKNSELDKKDS